MSTLSTPKTDAIAAYNKADEAGKTMLRELFGKEAFTLEITERVKTFEDACEVLGIDFVDFEEDETADEIAYRQLKIVCQALNEGWKPDWSDSQESKYYPWFNMDQSDSGFSYYYYGCISSISLVGSRLCFKSSKLAEYAGKQFLTIYKAFLTL